MAVHHYLRPSLRLRRWPAPARSAIAATMVFISFGVRYLGFPIPAAAPYLLFLPAIILCAVYLGRGAGFLATGLSAALAYYFFVPPTHSFEFKNVTSTVDLGVSVLVGAFIAFVVEALHQAYAEVEEAHREADQARQRAEELRIAAEEAMARAQAGERERELLMAELGHRVKNDLARILATVEIQAAGAAKEAAEAVRTIAERIRVMSRVHDRLSNRDGHATVDVRDFLHDLVADLRVTATGLKPIGLFIEAESHMLSVARAGAVGLIANELVTNAIKHGFPEDRAGSIYVSFHRSGDSFELSVTDTGVGLPPANAERMRQDAVRRDGMGHRLVRALAAQLGGTLDVTPAQNGNGTTCALRFPIVPPGDPIGEA